MQFEEWKILVKGLKSVYTSERFLPDAESIKIWFQMLQDLSYKQLNVAIQKYMLTNKFPPTIADIREISANVVNGDLPDWGEGWEQVLKAIRRYGMYRIDEAMETFDPITKRCVERLGFRNICLSEDISIDRANFRMIYEQLAEREKKDAQIPVKLSQMIEGIRGERLMLEKGELNNAK